MIEPHNFVMPKVYPQRRATAANGPEQWRGTINVAPPGWEGTVKAMKKEPNISNPFALAWYEKNKGETSHK